MLLIDKAQTKCPDERKIAPCTCNDYYGPIRLGCKVSNIDDIKGLFQNISKALDANEKLIDEFLLADVTFSELPGHLFGDLTFKSVAFLNFTNLNYMDEQLFNGTETSIETIIFEKLNLTDRANMFKAINTLVNLRELILTEVDFHTIPENAFETHSKL